MGGLTVLPTDGRRLQRAVPGLMMAHRMVERELVIEIDGAEPAVYARLKGCTKREKLAGCDRLRLVMRRLYGAEDGRQGLLGLDDAGATGEGRAE